MTARLRMRALVSPMLLALVLGAALLQARRADATYFCGRYANSGFTCCQQSYNDCGAGDDDWKYTEFTTYQGCSCHGGPITFRNCHFFGSCECKSCDGGSDDGSDGSDDGVIGDDDDDDSSDGSDDGGDPY